MLGIGDPQSGLPDQAGAAKFGWDKRFGLWKLNPLADWTDEQVWNHIRENEVPYNPLHDEGYPSIGCTHCTIRPGAEPTPEPAVGPEPTGPSAASMGSAETALALTLTARQASDFELLANGGFAPLTGYLGSEDHKSVCENMRLTSGEIWPIPITLATDLECEVGDVIELSAERQAARAPDGVEIFDRDVELEAEKVYRTTDNEHPGVAAIREEGSRCLAGTIEADALPDHDEAFMRRYQTPAESKQAFADRGWKRIVAFQTRNPIHRAHEYLTKAALEIYDGLYIHPLIGETKKGDIPATCGCAATRS